MATQDLIESRRTRVADLLSQRGLLTLGELRSLLSVSESTIRRDLETLEELGIVRRTHGGAVRTRYGQNLNFDDRQTSMAAQKEAIASAVAALVQDEQTVILDGGTTCFQVAKSLQGRRLSVVTNSIPIATLLSGDIATEVTVVGGYLYPRTGVALGSTAQSQFSGLRASMLIMSCAGLGPDGAFNTNQMMVDVERKMMESADQVVLAVDSSKFQQRGLAKLCELSELDAIVTDGGVSDDMRRMLESAGPRLIVAQ